MITWGDVYKVVSAMVPLYVALGLGFLSIKGWRMFEIEQCNGINRLNCYFVVPFFNLKFTSSINPYNMSLRYIASDVVAKAIFATVLIVWVTTSKKASASWAITTFSLACLNNTLVLGVPLLSAMYGPAGRDLAITSQVMQTLIWFPTLLFLLEFQYAKTAARPAALDPPSRDQPPHVVVEVGPDATNATTTTTTTNNSNVQNTASESNVQNTATQSNVQNTATQSNVQNTATQSNVQNTASQSNVQNTASQSNLSTILKKVFLKLAANPNSYACPIGLTWAFLAQRFDIELPTLVQGSIMIMANAGSCLAMFSLGIFMALQEKVISCGIKRAAFALVLRFVVGPLVMFSSSLALGLRSNILRVAIMTAALPQSILSCIIAQEYNVNPTVLSTAVIFGMIISLPLLIGYYSILDIV
ncbi:auxin efflux carrier component 5-like [Andrographis paniculata]|uniref:auxin efflux carrier component 5-like n=1 Tax=Andrographis paniculata TaxID=175694 RepID=UPI0021E70BB7|nr:auxin efflux carrier component 5-like [Andrographis paniculata]